MLKLYIFFAYSLKQFVSHMFKTWQQTAWLVGIYCENNPYISFFCGTCITASVHVFEFLVQKE